MTLQPHVRVAATFQPRNADDLKPGAAELIGMSGEFDALWIIEEGQPYAGEWAMSIPQDWRSLDFVWVPSGDLANMKEVS